MRWRDRRGSSNIEDRRGMRAPRSPMRLPLPRSRGARGGGMGIGGIVLLLIIAWVTGINPLSLLVGDMGGSPSTAPSQSVPKAELSETSDETAKFISVVLADIENTWTQILAAEGVDYPAPTLVLFNDAVRSACGTATAAVGPFYCGEDRKIYIDLAFYQQLAGQLQAPGDFAQAYVLAHEVGHHMQNVLGLLPKFHQAQQSMNKRDANALSVRMELQADCFAGIWAHYAARQDGFVEEGDIEEALNAASRIGDDTMQKRAQGYVVPDSFNHGTSEQRERWFARGFQAGQIGACDTISPDQL